MKRCLVWNESAKGETLAVSLGTFSVPGDRIFPACQADEYSQTNPSKSLTPPYNDNTLSYSLAQGQRNAIGCSAGDIPLSKLLCRRVVVNLWDEAHFCGQGLDPQPPSSVSEADVSAFEFAESLPSQELKKKPA